MRETKKTRWPALVLGTCALAGILACVPGGLAAQDLGRMERERALEELQRVVARTSDLSRAVAAGASLRAQEMELRAREMAMADHVGAVRAVADHMRRVEEALAQQGLGSSGSGFRTRAPAPWLSQDPADSLYRAARDALNARRYAEAVRNFGQLRERYPRSGYVADAYYFQALALYRQGGSRGLEQARELLDQQLRDHPDASTSEDARALAVRIQSRLAREGDPAAAASVAQSASADCEDEDQSVRATALSALLQMDSEQAMPILREVLKDRGECSAALRKQAVFLISQKMTDDDVDILVDLAVGNPDPDPEVREAAVFWLSQSRSEKALDALLSIIESGTADATVQKKAVFAIAQHSSPRAAEALRTYARNASAPTDLRSDAIFWLGQRRGADGGSFLRDLYGSLQDPDLKDRVLFSVAQNPSEANRGWLLARARDANEPIQVRKKALFWAGQAGLGPQEALEIYRSAQDTEMKEQALLVLTQVKDDRGAAVDALMEIARTEQDPELKKRAVFWLGQSKDPRVADFLLQLIRGG